jgi:hypothetical protein
LAVTFGHYGPYFSRERDAHFTIRFAGREYPFEADFDYGELKIRTALQNISTLELSEKMDELNEKHFFARSLGVELNEIMRKNVSNLPQIFVEVWHCAISEHEKLDNSRRVSVHYEPSFSHGIRIWNVCS